MPPRIPLPLPILLAAVLLSGCAVPSGERRMWDALSTSGLREGKIALASGALEVRWEGRGTVRLADFDRITPASTLRERDYPGRVWQEGTGEPAVLYRARRSDEAFVSALGTALPVTLVRGEGTLHLCDVLNDDDFGGRQLAADFTAPFAYLRKQDDLHLPVVKAMLRGGDYLEDSGLFRFEPVDPKRIPVIFVHGLKSSPSIWKIMVNELRRDEAVRENYQFWSFSYPTGIPVLYAAKLLRDELGRAQAAYNPDGRNPHWNHMVLVGHSMGGLVARLQVTDSGKAFAEMTALGVGGAVAGTEGIVRDSVVFKSAPFVDRVVFIATPHGGSEVALSGIGGLVSSLIRVPTELTGAFREILARIPGLDEEKVELPTSIGDLDPGSGFLRALATRPIPPRVTYHSIIASGKKKDASLEAMDDGLVTYRSASLPGAASEVIVPGGHRAPKSLEAVAEVTRILGENLRAGWRE